jgi:hypothetical protein
MKRGSITPAPGRAVHSPIIELGTSSRRTIPSGVRARLQKPGTTIEPEGRPLLPTPNIFFKRLQHHLTQTSSFSQFSSPNSFTCREHGGPSCSATASATDSDASRNLHTKIRVPCFAPLFIRGKPDHSPAQADPSGVRALADPNDRPRPILSAPLFAPTTKAAPSPHATSLTVTVIDKRPGADKGTRGLPPARSLDHDRLSLQHRPDHEQASRASRAISRAYLHGELFAGHPSNPFPYFPNNHNLPPHRTPQPSPPIITSACPIRIAVPLRSGKNRSEQQDRGLRIRSDPAECPARFPPARTSRPSPGPVSPFSPPRARRRSAPPASFFLFTNTSYRESFPSKHATRLRKGPRLGECLS